LGSQAHLLSYKLSTEFFNRLLGFTPLPSLYFLFLAGMTVTYLLLVELVKHWLMRRLVE
jgi:hypothetical protein